MSITDSDRNVIKVLLGREPRGLEAVAVRDKQGEPMVIRVSVLVGDKPFPTLFWLIDKRLNYAIDQLEAGGLIAQFQRQVDESPELQVQVAADHREHITLRQLYMTDAIRLRVQALGFTEVLFSRGIGGIADFQRIRCLHTYYAAHLVCPNTIGTMLEQHCLAAGIAFPQL
ncbi:MAG: hypothetical protein ACI9NY_000859 [Kiritimatiellia bacterium]|jgi:hypothetical protein